MLKLNEKIEKAFKEACEKTGRPESIDFSGYPEDMRDQEKADYMLKVITEAKNDGWKADWNNSEQRKWFPYFWFSPSGVRFSVSICDCSDAAAGRGARLCFRSEELSDAAGIELKELYEIALNG